jgi:hypothetical protein
LFYLRLQSIVTEPKSRTRSFTRSKLYGEVLSLRMVEYESIG